MTLDPLADRFAGALLGTFAGDALGMPVENWSAEHIASTYGTLDHFHTAALWLRGYAFIYGSMYDPLHTKARVPLAKGTYTDDTQMMIAAAESLLDRKGFDGQHMASQFDRSFDPRRGYGPGTIAAIRGIRGGTPWKQVGLRLFKGTGSFGNGAAMRVAPVTLFCYSKQADLRAMVTESAMITHAHPLGIEGAMVQALAIDLALRIGMKSEAIEPVIFLDRLREALPELSDVFGKKLSGIEDLLTSEPDVREVVQRLGNNTTAQGSVPAAIYSFLAHSSNFKDAVVYAVSLGGDTDTIGAMTGAIAGAYHGATTIPGDWLAAMEDGGKGKTYVRRLADDLWKIAAPA